MKDKLNATFPCLMVISEKGREFDGPLYVHLHNEEDVRRANSRLADKREAYGWSPGVAIRQYSTEYTTAAEHDADVVACMAEPNSSTKDPKPTYEQLEEKIVRLDGMLEQRVKEVDSLYQEGRSPRGTVEMLQQELRVERVKVNDLRRQLQDEVTYSHELELEVAKHREKMIPTFGAPITGMTFPFTIDTPHRDIVEITVTWVGIANGKHRVHMTADIRLPETQPQEAPSPVGGPEFVEVRDVPGVVTQLSLDLDVAPPPPEPVTEPVAPPPPTGNTAGKSQEHANLLAYEQAGAVADSAPKLTASAADTTENYAHPTEGAGNMRNTTTVLSTELVPFHGSMLEAGKADDKVWVSVRRMCEPLEIDYSGQHQRLSRPASCPWAVVGMMPMTGPDGKVYKTFCIDLDTVPMWLATLDSSRVASHLRERIVLFQREATKALRDHFFKAPKPSTPPTRTEIARMLLIECERAEKLEAEKQVLEHTVDTLVAEVEAVDARNAELEPIVETHRELTDANGLSSMTQVAMSIKEGLQRLYQWLREDGFIQPYPSCLPYQQHIDNGLFDLICVPYRKKDKKGMMVDHVRYVTHATAKGLTVLAARYRRGGTHSRWDKPMKRTKKVKSVPTL